MAACWSNANTLSSKCSTNWRRFTAGISHDETGTHSATVRRYRRGRIILAADARRPARERPRAALVYGIVAGRARRSDDTHSNGFRFASAAAMAVRRNRAPAIGHAYI